MTSFYPANEPPSATIPQYANVSLLPVSGTTGDLAIVLDTNSLYLYQGGWVEIATEDIVTADLQYIYNQSTAPQLVTSLAKGALVVRRGALATAGDLITIQNDSGTRVAGISDTGVLTLGTGLGVLHSDASGVITSSTIVNADISPSAAIAGTKVSPDFGAQNIVTTGDMDAANVYASFVTAGEIYGSLDRATPGTLYIGQAIATAIEIGTGPTTNTITLGGVNDTVVVAGTLTTVNTTNLEVADKNIVLNKGGAASSAGLAGIDFEEDGAITGYVRASSTRTSIELKAPATAGEIELVPASFDTLVTATSTSIRSLSLPDVSGTLISNGDTGTVTSAMIATATIVDTNISLSAAIAGTKIEAASDSVPGVVSTGTQTLAGAKTLSGITTVSNSTASTSSTTGALVVTGGAGLGGAINATGDIRAGSNRGSDGAAAFNLQAVSGAAATTAQLLRASGANGNLSLLNTGTGTTVINNNAGTGTGNGTLVQGVRTSTTINASVGSAYGTAAGYIGEIIESGIGATSLTDTTWVRVATITLTPGIWLVSGQVAIGTASGGGAARGEMAVSIGTVDGGPSAFNATWNMNDMTLSNALTKFLSPATKAVAVVTSTPYYMCCYVDSAGTAPVTVSGYGYFQAVRIA